MFLPDIQCLCLLILTLPFVLTSVLLDLEENRITGLAFPEELFDLRSLVSYRISNNFLSGSIPSRIKDMEELCQVSCKQKARLHHCNSHSFHSNIRSDTQLWAASNRLTGIIPKEIAASRKMESLLLYENKLTGALPVELGELENLYGKKTD